MLTRFRNHGIPPILLTGIVVVLIGGAFVFVRPQQSAQEASFPVGHIEAAVPTPFVYSVPKDGRILMYHYIRTGVNPYYDPIGYGLSISPAALDRQLTTLTAAGYKSATIDQMLSGQVSGKVAALTFDDGYEDFYTAAYPILKKHGWTATLYVISGKIGQEPYLTWDQIRELQRQGFEIGAHTVNHPDLATLSAEDQLQEIIDSKSTIEREIGAPVTAFCYPSGKYTRTTVGLVRAAGYSSATTTVENILTPQDAMLTLPRLRVAPDTTADELAGPFPFPETHL